MKLHHLISDGWSQVLLCNKLQKIYLDLLEGARCSCRLRRNTGCMSARSSSICKAPPAEKMRLTGAALFEQSCEPASLQQVHSAAVSPVGERKSYLLPKSVSYAMMRFCQQRRVGAFCCVLHGLGHLPEKAARLENPVIGVPVFNRLQFYSQTDNRHVCQHPSLLVPDG